MTAEEIVAKLQTLGSPENVAGMARYGIKTRAFGIAAPILKAFAREAKDQAADRHALAEQLWQTGIYEARMVAVLIDDPKQVTRRQMKSWARDFDNWATVDGACGHLFCHTPLAYDMVPVWAGDGSEFIKRAAFSLIAFLTVHDKTADDAKFAAFLPLIEEHASDDRNFVRKAANWALRQIGKRSLTLNRQAIAIAESIKLQDSSSAHWIASDALRELKSEKVKEPLKNKAFKPKKTPERRSSE